MTPHMEKSENYPASRYAAVAGVSRKTVRDWLKSVQPASYAVIGGNMTALFDWRSVEKLKSALEARAAQIGDTVENLLRISGPRPAAPNAAGVVGDVGPLDPKTKRPFALRDVHLDDISSAHKLREALRPAFESERAKDLSRSEIEKRGVEDYARAFNQPKGERISRRHFRELLARTRRQAGVLLQYRRLEAYLPEHPRRSGDPDAPAPVTVPAEDFKPIQRAIDGCDPATRNLEARLPIWRASFELYERLVDESGIHYREAGTLIRAFLMDHAPWLAASPDALLKAWNYNWEKQKANQLGDGRKVKGDATREKLQCDLTRQINALDWFIPAARFFYLMSNTARNQGSVPEAVRRTISLPKTPVGWTPGTVKQLLKKLKLKLPPGCPVELRETILARQRNAQPLVPEGIARQIIVNRSIVQQHRSPHAWALDNLSAPGSQRRYFNKETNQREIMLPGDWFGGDDATPGIAVCVPCSEVITPCSQKFGVLIGRFQWLAYHDCRTDKILAWDYVIRPRGSYRAEDVVNGIGAVTRTHGVPRKGWQFEGGTFNARLVRDAINLLGCEHWRTYSPHQKSIEKVFDKVWTQLAVQFPHADMGRYRNENEANCAIYEACKRGNKDPRRYFPTIEQVLAAFSEVIEDPINGHNSKLIVSEQYGRWVPDEFFASGITEQPLRPYDDAMAWIFSPYSVERKVKGAMVSCKVRMFEDFSVPFEFAGDWLALHHGRLVRLHFDPRAPGCKAKVVLLEAHGQFTAGQVLGDAELISETAGYIRMVMGWANDDQRAGYVARQRTNNFMRRETRGVGHGGRPTYAKSEHRDGIGTVQTAERDKPRKDRGTDCEKTGSQDRLRQTLALAPETAAVREAYEPHDPARLAALEQFENDPLNFC